MADDPQAAHSAFPDPPNFYTHFTPENLSLLEIHRSASNSNPPSTFPESSALEYLIPPPPPPNGSYWSFSNHWQYPERHPSLEENGIPRLYSEDNEVSGAKRVVELRRLSKSLLLNYLELVGVMAVNPEDYYTKTSDLQNILFNMHHLINQYRPHQARETLCLMMEEQLERVKRETEENRNAVRKVDEALAQVEAVGRMVRQEEEKERQVKGNGMETLGEEEKARRRDEEGWKLILGAV